MRRLKKIAIVLSVGYLLITALAYFYQERLIFFPSKMPMNHTYDFCQPYKEFFIDTEDGARLNAVHIKQEDAKGVILYFHGNSGNISHLNHVANRFSRNGYESILVDYRTYGKSSGELSEEALYSDAEKFYDYALEHYDENNIILYGRSFGTGVATWLASEHHPGRLILESPFFSAVDLGKHRFPFLPIDWLSKFRFPSNEYIKDVTCAIYLFHGKEDSVIPYTSAKRLYECIPGTNKHLIMVKDAGHNYLQDFDVFKKGLREALK
ncbi:alpha/beta hydrolase [Pseudozobellia thermophila]|uniref:Serine aminopeptidase S33 domain-containing protein n=1 Tax=Pseudozobellia thermophila TaxID=192903 RepID=A0A1M6ET86_9FLAO|nr:alpha/beta fold hydrolase [Pseudozobellia thermophila]SHI88691.1 hypothetical protein SAMN04488513_102170 [Pseudozobellia thermophila]